MKQKVKKMNLKREKIAILSLFIAFGMSPVFAQHVTIDKLRPQVCGSHSGCCQRADSCVTPQDVSPSTLIIYYEKSNKRILKAAKKIGAEVVYTYQNFNAVALRKPDTWSLERTKAYFEHVKGVLQVSYDQVYHID